MFFGSHAKIFLCLCKPLLQEIRKKKDYWLKLKKENVLSDKIESPVSKLWCVLSIKNLCPCALFGKKDRSHLVISVNIPPTFGLFATPLRRPRESKLQNARWGRVGTEISQGVQQLHLAQCRTAFRRFHSGWTWRELRINYLDYFLKEETSQSHSSRLLSRSKHLHQSLCTLLIFSFFRRMHHWKRHFFSNRSPIGIEQEKTARSTMFCETNFNRIKFKLNWKKIGDWKTRPASDALASDTPPS